ncbi:MAG: hypothetical protein IT320_24310 [Anaerolineae bacterium]|nr:hypothetical protein [Anaerolineae bacterium]
MLHRLNRFLRRISSDLLKGHNLDAYVIALFGLALIVVDLAGNVEQSTQLTLIVAALTFLVLRATVPESGIFNLDDVLKDRQAFGPFKEFIHGRRSLWMWAPSAVNIFNDASSIKAEILDPGGEVCVLLLDPAAEAITPHVQKQLDSTGDELLGDIRRTARMLETLKQSGNVSYGYLPYSPGFSLTIVDHDKPGGKLLVEYHGFRNEFTGNRMHIVIERAQSEYWFNYWVNQFEEMRKVAAFASGSSGS